VFDHCPATEPQQGLIASHSLAKSSGQNANLASERGGGAQSPSSSRR